MIIVSNTGPIIALAKINKLTLLKDLASEVLIPPVVHRELFAKVGRESPEIDRALSDFIHVAEVKEIKNAYQVKVDNSRLRLNVVLGCRPEIRTHDFF